MPIFAFGFTAFILWIIYLANTGGQSIFFEFVNAIPYGDKLGHFGLFGMLTLLLNFTCKLKTIKVRSAQLYVGALLVLTFAVIEELSQFFVASRTLDLIDVLADIAGILCFSGLTFLLNKWSSQYESNKIS
jgi:hypothetical protein